MSDLSRVQSLYLQGAPPKIVVDEIKRCSEWEGVSFQDQFAHDVNTMTTDLTQQCLSHPLIEKNGRDEEYESSVVRLYFSALMDKYVV